MTLINGISNNFAFLYNMVSGVLLLWVAVAIYTAYLVKTMAEGRGALWGAMSSSVGAVIILLIIELNDDVKEIKSVLSNFIIMTLGGLGSGLLAVAMITKSNDAEALKFKLRLFNSLDYAFVWLGLSSLSMLFFFLISTLSGWLSSPEFVLEVMCITLFGAFLSLVALEWRRKFSSWGGWVGVLLFVILVVLLLLYGTTLASVWRQAHGWILTLNVTVALAIFGVSIYYRRLHAPIVTPAVTISHLA